MFNTTRAQIAETLSLVDGVTGHEFRPSVIGSGDAWPLIASVNSSEGWDYQTEWRILVALSGDEQTAAEQFVSLVPQLIDALRSVVWVESAAPVTIQTSAGDVPALQLTARSD